MTGFPSWCRSQRYDRLSKGCEMQTQCRSQTCLVLFLVFCRARKGAASGGAHQAAGQHDAPPRSSCRRSAELDVGAAMQRAGEFGEGDESDSCRNSRPRQQCYSCRNWTYPPPDGARRAGADRDRGGRFLRPAPRRGLAWGRGQATPWRIEAESVSYRHWVSNETSNEVKKSVTSSSGKSKRSSESMGVLPTSRW